MWKASVPLVAAAAAIVAIGAAGCGGSNSNSTNAGSAQSSGAKYQIAFVNPLPQNPQWKEVGVCMGRTANKLGVQYDETGPTGEALDPNTMMTQIEQAISAKDSAIITFPASTGFAPLLEQAQKAHIVTTTVAGSGAAGSGADINVGIDWTALGKLYVQEIAKRPGVQYVGLVAQSPTGIAEEWANAMKAAAATTKNVRIVATVYTDDDTTQALPEVTDLLTAHPNINVVASHMGSATEGALAAIKSKGLAGKVAYVGNGFANGGSQGLANGSIYSLLLQNLCGAGTVAMQQTVDALEGKAKTPRIGAAPTNAVEPTAMVTARDYKQYGKGWG